MATPISRENQSELLYLSMYETVSTLISKSLITMIIVANCNFAKSRCLPPVHGIFNKKTVASKLRPQTRKQVILFFGPKGTVMSLTVSKIFRISNTFISLISGKVHNVLAAGRDMVYNGGVTLVQLIPCYPRSTCHYTGQKRTKMSNIFVVL